MPDRRIQFGQTGERLAEEHLRRSGMKLIARHYTTPVGELDLVMLAGKTVVFVEVKTRSDRRLADPQDAVRGIKQSRMARAAEWFLNRKCWTDRPARFDVVAIVLAEGRPPEIEHFADAFEAGR